jgi:copper resistance protein C
MSSGDASYPWKSSVVKGFTLTRRRVDLEPFLEGLPDGSFIADARHHKPRLSPDHNSEAVLGGTMVHRSIYALLLTAMVAASAVVVFAHMKASKMEPAANSTVSAPPARIQVWFTEAPDPKVSKLELAGPAGPVKLTGFQATAEKSIVAGVDGSLADGRYTARWQSAGDDGHVQKGEYGFTVKRAN